jgi:hypothetical protein
VKFGNAAAFDPIPPPPGQRPVSCLERCGERARNEPNSREGVGVRDGSQWLAVPLFV